MVDRYLNPLAAMLVAASILPTLGTAETLPGDPNPLPAPLCSREASLSSGSASLFEGEGPLVPPAGKVVAEACESVDVAALAGNDLIDYLRNTSKDCLQSTLHTSENPSIRGDLPAIFSDDNMESVFAEIEESASVYDGTNSTGMLQLWFFVQVGYGYHWFFHERTGVGPFSEETHRAYLAASDAFAANDHFNAANDQAAWILYYYFETAYTSGLRQNHLDPIKQVLSELTPERAASWDQSRPFRHILNRVHAAVLFGDNRMFLDALAKDPEFVDVMLQVTRYDFYFLIEEDNPFTPRLALLETAVNILVRLTWLDSLNETAVKALTSVLSWHERLSSAFMVAAAGVENRVDDCSSLNICRDVLEEEIFTQALPNTYSFDDGELVFVTSLELEEAGPLYQAAKEVQAQFFRLVETDRPVNEKRKVFTARIYGTQIEYAIYERYLSNQDTRGIHLGGFYTVGTMGTFVTDDLEKTFRHEYVHYLADRFGLLHGGPWFDEGLAEFLVGSTAAGGIPVRWDLVWKMVNDESPLDLAKIFESQYSAELGGSRFYFYSGLFFSFLHRERRTPLFELFDLVRDGDEAAYNALTAAWAADTQLASDFTAFLDAEAASFEWWAEPPATTAFPRLEALSSDSAEEIGSALQRIGGDFDLDCRSAGTQFGQRFECTGSLSPDSLFNEDRGALNRHFNHLLDGFMASAMEQGEINNFQFMTCYFANLTGSPPAADLTCEGPLRPEGLAAAQVDLKTTLVSQSGNSAKVGGNLRLNTTLDFPEQAAANVTLTWSASLPVRLSAHVDGRVWCEIANRSGLEGTYSCGHIDKESGTGLPLDISLRLIPLQPGSLDFSVQFSSDEAEIEPEDNDASLQFEISLAPEEIASLEGHTLGVVAVAFSPDGTMLASGSPDSTVKLWDVETRTNTATLTGHTDLVLSVAFSPDGRILAAGATDGTIKLWDLETRTNTATLEGHTDDVRSVDFSPDGTTLASGGDDHTVKLWDLETQTNTATLFAHDFWISAVAFSPDGTTLASGAADETIRLWDVETRTNTATLEGHTSRVYSVGFSPDGTVLASSSADGTARLWDLETGRTTATFQQGLWPVQSVDISPQGNTLVSTRDRQILLWDIVTGSRVATLEGHTWSVEYVAFSPDGATVASASLDRTVKLWNVSRWTMAPPSVLPHPRTLTKFSGDKQQAQAGALLAEPFVVSVLDQNGSPFAGATVTFTVTAGGGTLSTAAATTDENGRASTTLALGNDQGRNTVAVRVAELKPVIFSATGKAVPHTLTKVSGDGQEGPPSAELAEPFVVSVLDRNGKPLEGESVTFSVTAGTGRLSGLFTVETARTDAEGRAELMLTLGPGMGANTVLVSLNEIAPVAFNAVSVGTPTVPTDYDDFRTWNLPEVAVSRLGKGRMGEGERAVSFSPGGNFLAVASGIGIWLYDMATFRATTLLSSRDRINSVWFSPDGATLLSRSGNSFDSWDVASGTHIGTIEDNEDHIVFAELSPDGTTLASGTWDGDVTFWNVETGQNTSTLEGHTDVIRSVIFSPEGTTLASETRHTIKLWSLTTGENTATLSGHGEFGNARFSPDGSTLAYVAGNTVKMLDLATGTHTRTIETYEQSVTSLTFSPDGRSLASGAYGGQVKLWEVATGRNITNLNGHSEDVDHVTFSPDGTVLASASSDGVVQLWEVANGTYMATTREHTAALETVRFSPDGSKLVSASKDGTVNLWDTSTGNAATLSGHSSGISSMAVSPNGSILASGLEDGNINLWEIRTRTHQSTFHDHNGQVNSLAFSPDGTILASGSSDKTIKLWEVDTGRNTATFSGHTGRVLSVAFSTDGTSLASGGADATVKLWDVKTGTDTATLSGSSGWVRSVAFSPDGNTLAYAPQDGMVRLWDMSKGESTTNSDGPREGVLALAFSPDGTTLASGSWEGSVVLWNLETGETTATVSYGVGWVTSLAFSPDGTILASGSSPFSKPNYSVNLLDMETGTDIGSLGGQHGVNSVVFDPDGRTLASASWDGTILLWDVQLIFPHPRTLAKLSGDAQQAAPGAALGEPLAVSVLDQNGAPFAGATVSFAVTAGGGTLSTTSAATDENGQAATTLTLGSEPGAHTVTASVAGLEPVTFNATAEATPDFDGDGETGFSDFFLFADAFGGSEPRFDLDGSGTVDFADFFLLADHFADPARGKLLALAREMIGLPDGPQLRQNAPNPFNSETVISWFLLRPGKARLEVFALTGQRVAVLHEGPKKAGVHRVHWNGRGDRGRPLGSGVYLYRLVTGESAQTRKLTLLR